MILMLRPPIMVSEHQKFPLKIAEWCLIQGVRCVDRAGVDLLAAVVPPNEGWRAANHSESPNALEQIVGLVR